MLQYLPIVLARVVSVSPSSRMVKSSDTCAEELLLDYIHNIMCIEDVHGRDNECPAAVKI